MMITKEMQVGRITTATKEHFSQHKTGPVMVLCTYLNKEVTGNECGTCHEKHGKCKETYMCEHKSVSILEKNEFQTFKLCNDCNASITETYARDTKGRIIQIETEIEYPDDNAPSEMLR